LNCGGNGGFMQIQEFFFGFALYQVFLASLSSVYMDKILTMIISYLGGLENFIHKFIQKFHSLVIVLFVLFLLFECVKGIHPPEDKVAYKI
jgi:hypothetical protein